MAGTWKTVCIAQDSFSGMPLFREKEMAPCKIVVVDVEFQNLNWLRQVDGGDTVEHKPKKSATNLFSYGAIHWCLESWHQFEKIIYGCRSTVDQTHVSHLLYLSSTPEGTPILICQSTAVSLVHWVQLVQEPS